MAHPTRLLIRGARFRLVMTFSLVLLVSLAHAEQSAETKCQAKLYRRTGAYVRCLLAAEAAQAKGRHAEKNARAREACRAAHQKAYDAALKLSVAGCPFAGAGELGASFPLAQAGRQMVDMVRGMVAGAPPTPIDGELTIYNNCSTPMKIMSPTSSTIDGTTLQSYASTQYATAAGGGLGQNTANTFLFAPITSDAQCTQAQCGNWTDILTAAGQRMGYMWMDNSSDVPPGNDNLTYAAYCQPTNAAAGQCTTTSSTPCCGSQMNYDKTFGTTFEITPNGGTTGSQDFIDLSTNYGSGPTSPPTLCGTPGANANDCVTAGANIFFNVPIEVVTTLGDNQPPSAQCTYPQGGTSLSCTAVSCTDAFQYPEDDKQVACPAGTGYVVTLCPGTNQLPPLG